MDSTWDGLASNIGDACGPAWQLSGYMVTVTFKISRVPGSKFTSSDQRSAIPTTLCCLVHIVPRLSNHLPGSRSCACDSRRAADEKLLPRMILSDTSAIQSATASFPYSDTHRWLRRLSAVAVKKGTMLLATGGSQEGKSISMSDSDAACLTTKANKEGKVHWDRCRASVICIATVFTRKVGVITVGQCSMHGII